MAIELPNNITGLNEGYKADVMGMLVGETESGVIEWKPRLGSLGSTWYEAKLSDKLTVEITPMDFSEKTKEVKLVQEVDGAADIKCVIGNSSPFFETRITELERAIFDKLYKQGFTDVFKTIREKRDRKQEQPKREQRKSVPKPLKLYYPDSDKSVNIPAISKPQEEKFYPNDHKGTNIPELKKVKKAPERPVPHMRDEVAAAEFKRDVAHGIEKLAKRLGKKKKHCKITIEKIVVEVWSDPVIK